MEEIQKFKPILRWLLVITTLLTTYVSITMSLTSDGLALTQMQNGLTVKSPLLGNWSPLDASPCSWGGINCTKDNRVWSIILSSQSPMLEGNISASLGKLEFLQELWLDNNLLSGNIPPELGNLTNLVILSLWANGLLGQIPPSLGNCSNLVDLRLDENLLLGAIPESLGNLKNLGYIGLSFNSLIGEIPYSLAALPKLHTFDVSYNGLSGFVPSVIYKNLNLQDFLVSANQLIGNITTDLEELSKLPAITNILMANNSFTGTLPPSIGNATNLIWLNLGNQNGGGLGGRIPKELGKLINLTQLGLDGNSFIGDIPAELGNLTSLIAVGLSANHLSGTIPSSLGNLVHLSHLDMGYNAITGPIPTTFASLNKLTYLFLSNNSISGPIPTNMSKLTSLEMLVVQFNNMSGSIPKDFGRFMPNFTDFGISGNSFTGILPDGLCQGGNLQRIEAGGNQFQGNALSPLANCSSLRNVDFSENELTSVPEGFGSNSSMIWINLQSNKLTGPIPAGLGANSQVIVIALGYNSLVGNLSALEFSQIAQNLTYLDLAVNNFTGEIPIAMAMCSLLFYVDLSHNSLSGIVPWALSNLSRLETLLLESNNFVGVDSSLYSGLGATLRTLNLAENPWNTPIASQIGSLKILVNLNLSYGRHTGSIPSEFGKLTQLEILDLSHNNLTGEVPGGVGEEMVSLTLVNISFNHLTGSLPIKWVKLLKRCPDCFIGNAGLCLDYDANNVCVNKRMVDNFGEAKLSVGIIVAIVLGVALALLLILASFCCWHTHAITNTKPPLLENTIVENLTNMPLPITFEEIMVATDNLSDTYIIGRGGHGAVYKVTLASGSSIVVKKVVSLDNTSIVVHKSFWREIHTVGKAKHRNLVRLLGFMKRGQVGLLLYDYVSNGDLHSALYKKKVQGSHMVNLTWTTRLRIAEGVAQGLAYLHHDYDPPIVHRDIKSSNILLDNDLEAHISDFGLAKVLEVHMPSGSEQWLSSANVSRTYGYIAPEVGYGTLVSPKLDVYSYGVLLLELITGKQPVDASHGETWHIVEWVKASVLQNEGQMTDCVLDPLLIKNLNVTTKNEMLFVQRIALLCTRATPTDRPTMRDVADLLKSLSQTLKDKNENGIIEHGESSTCE
ncbi:hypothetical protein M758_9G099900 [Ceratodon purpureus]|nr:hypothetical protein M758_9G099900 [Ceratodon purpureus]